MTAVSKAWCCCQRQCPAGVVLLPTTVPNRCSLHVPCQGNTVSQSIIIVCREPAQAARHRCSQAASAEGLQC